MASVVAASSAVQLADALQAAGPRGVIPRGLGRSYGDAAQNAGGTVLDMTTLRRVHSVDADTGLVDTDAGVSLDELMQRTLPFGLWIPVLPGTRQVTVGGAIAADVHGKNHHVHGSFGNHVRSLELLLADGTVQTLTPDGDTAAEFWATVGGMGLTGVILRARIQLAPVETAYFSVDTERTANLDELMIKLAEGDDRHTYSVAWFDSVSRGNSLGRAVITRGRSARVDELPLKLRRAPLASDAPRLGTAPPVFPGGLLNRVSVGAFNELWYRKAPRERRGEIQNITTFFHPLDVIGDWNRIYGPRGFLQYQFVVPVGAEDAVRVAVEAISASGHVSFLNVLKRFGAANPGPLSFPMPGWTLAVDMPVRAGLAELCDELDELVLAAGGRIYLAKDSRVDAATLARMYPRLDEWRKVRDALDPDGVFSSDLQRRLSL
ncbi:MAG: FAD-binding oxidoreductase [Pseudonocardiales bacterium]|nr:FAD-binding oxidoreductase [Pseudonocardiales bacterium]